MTVARILIRAAVALAVEGARAAVKYSRKMTPRQLKEEFARWDANHYPHDGVCNVCGLVGAARDAKCPGTPAQQRARAELAAGDDHLHAEPRAKP
jgi:hypothetical protein